MTDRHERDPQTETASDRALVCSTDNDGDAGVYGYAFDAATGELDELASTAFARPMYLAVSAEGTRAYVANRAEEGSVVAVEVDREHGAVSVLDERSSGGVGPCHVSLDGRERFAFAANYDGGTAAMLPVDRDGRLGPPCDVAVHEGSSVVSDRQAEPHPHSTVPGPDDRLLYVPDLGTDRVEGYDIVASEGAAADSEGAAPDGEGRLRPNEDASATLPPGTGPRHLAFGPEGEYGYLVGELDSTLTALTRDPETGALEPVASVGTVPSGEEDGNAPADVVVHPSGEWCYVSNRGHQSIATVAISDGRLDVRGHTPTGGENPRDVALAPGGEYLLVENRDSYEVATFAVGDDGGLSEVARTDVSKPTCLAFVPEP